MSASINVVRIPDWATTWAMPLPMVPAPTTSTFSMDAGSQFTDVSIVSRVHRSREVVDLRDIIKRVAEVAESTRVTPREQKLITSLPSRALMVDGDHTRLE